MTGGRKKFLSPETLDEAVGEIASLAKSERVRVALIGGYALQLYGSDRLTGDVDVVADDEIEALPPSRSLSFGGFQTKAPNGTPVDVVIRDDDYASLYKEALSKAARMHNVPIPVVRPEYIAAMKMVAGRSRDDADLEWLIGNQVIDTKKAHNIIKKHLGAYAAREFDQTVLEVSWRISIEVK